MKTLRSVCLIVAGLLLVITYNSCKKGPEDPAFSIWSRKHRVVGDWNVTSYKVNGIDSLREVLLAVDQLGPCGEELDSVVWTHEIKMTFDKNGGYRNDTKIIMDTITNIINNTVSCPDFFSRDSISGVTALDWNFTNNIGDVKNKEEIILFDPNTQLSTIYKLIELREKEIKMQLETIDPVTQLVTLREWTLSKI